MTNNPLADFMATESVQNLRKGWVLPRPLIRPILRTSIGDLKVNLFVAQRKLPFLLGNTLFQNNALLVPVAPDMRMVFGIAKRARDWGADVAQHEALKVAPLAAGDAFLATGARYRFRYTVLAVVFDEQKRTSPELIRRAVRRGTQLAGERGVTSLILPDMTENLLAQPNWITDAQRTETAQLTAFTLIDTIKACRGMVKTIHLWCWDPRNADIYLDELKRAK